MFEIYIQTYLLMQFMWVLLIYLLKILKLIIKCNILLTKNPLNINTIRYMRNQEKISTKRAGFKLK